MSQDEKNINNIISNCEALGYKYYINPNDINLHIPIYRFKKKLNSDYTLLLDVSTFNFHEHKDLSVAVSLYNSIDFGSSFQKSFQLDIKLSSIAYKDFIKAENEEKLINYLSLLLDLNPQP